MTDHRLNLLLFCAALLGSSILANAVSGADPISTSADETTVEIVVPADAAITNAANRSIQIPLNLAENDSPVEIELLYSDDQGKSWIPYKNMPFDPSLGSAPFTASHDGEYWFAFLSTAANGTQKATKVQKFSIQTPNTSSTFNGDRPPLLFDTVLEKPRDANSSSDREAALTSAVGSDPINLTAAESEQKAPESATAEEIPFPGKIKTVSVGMSAVGTPALSIRWYRGNDMGTGPEVGGKIRLERANQQDGPWTALADDAKELPLEAPGYWFALRQLDNPTFYLRTVSVDRYGKEWIDRIPINLSEQMKNLPETESTNSSGAFSNVSLEKELPSYQNEMKTQTPVKTWNDPLGESEKKELTAALDENKTPTVDKTASIKPTVPDTTPRTAAAPATYHNPQLGKWTLNPIFTRGFGVFSKKEPAEEIVNRAPPVPNITDYSPMNMPYSVGNPYETVPSGTPYSDTEWTPVPGQNNDMIYNTGPFAGINNNETIYLDANGNRIANPFPNGAPNFSDMPNAVNGSNSMNSGTLPEAFTPYGDSFNGQMNGSYMPNEYTLGLPEQFQSMPGENVFSTIPDPNGGPYSSQETTLGHETNLPGPQQQPFAPSVLPPKPQTR